MSARLCQSGFLASIGLWLLFLSSTHRQTDEKSGRSFLDSWGLGERLWGCFFLMQSPGPLVWVPPGTKQHGEEFAPPDVPQDHGFGSDSIREVMRPYSWASMFEFVLTVGRMALTSYSAWHCFFSLPERDPTATGNEAQHQISWFEFPAMVFLIIYSFSTICMREPFYTMMMMKLAAGFSALQILPLSSPMVVLRRVQQSIESASKRNFSAPWKLYVNVTMHVLLGCGAAIISALAVITKLHQVVFITDTIVNDWTSEEWLAFATFVNSLASLDRSSQAEIPAIMGFIKPGDMGFPGHWQATMGRRLREEFGLFGAILGMLSLNSKTVTKLLNKNARKNMDAQHVQELAVLK